jgi:hypothetical protein
MRAEDTPFACVVSLGSIGSQECQRCTNYLLEECLCWSYLGCGQSCDTFGVKLFRLFVLQSFQRLQKLTVPFVLVACPDRSLDRWVGYSWSLTCGNNGTFGCQMRTKATQADVSNPHAHCLAWVSSRSPHRQPIFRWLSINSSIAPFISTRHRLCTHKASS